jgi:hypothetical protein
MSVGADNARANEDSNWNLVASKNRQEAMVLAITIIEGYE